MKTKRLEPYSTAALVEANFRGRPHPYCVGSRLDLQFISNTTCSPCSLSVQVVKAFEPFTSAVALLVQPQSPMDMRALELPSQFIAKINDRRYTARQDIDVPEWSSSFKMHFQASVELALKARLTPDSFTSLHGTTPHPEGPKEDWIREIWLCEFKKECYDTEVAVYRELCTLQGSDIPYFYGTFRLLFASKSSVPMHENDVVASILDYAEGMALEYIDGLSLAEVKLDKNFPRAVVERASEQTLQIMNRLHNLGVWNGDPRPHNVLVRRQAPHNPVLIDFGLSRIKSPEMSVEQYKKSLAPGIDQVDDMRYALTHTGVHVDSPHPMVPNELYGYHYLNKWVDCHSKEWQEQFFDPVLVAEPGCKIIEVDGEWARWEFARWQLKPGAKTIGDH